MVEVIQSHQRRTPALSETEAPVWVKYAGDIFFLLLFLVFFFFIKPDQKTDHDEGNDSEAPNPLEAMLITEENTDEENSLDDKAGKAAGDKE